MKMEYAISAGPGTMVDVGEIEGSGYVLSRMNDLSDTALSFAFIDELKKYGYTIIIGPANSEGQ